MDVAASQDLDDDVRGNDKALPPLAVDRVSTAIRILRSRANLRCNRTLRAIIVRDRANLRCRRALRAIKCEKVTPILNIISKH
jgi:hypothetical protein